MNIDILNSLSNIIGDSYVNVAQNNRNSLSKKIKTLIDNRRVPDEPFSDVEIEICLKELANMDCNNASKFTGMGEREGRIYSDIVRNRNFHFSHGIGRSGDISALQPKAPGSSALNKLTNSLLLNLANEIGFKSAKSCVLFPMATGMTLALCMMGLRKIRPTARYVIWPRIDQKSCFKSILTAGFEPIIVEPIFVDDELQTNVATINSIITEKGVDNILCVMTTTSCFSPRVPDDITKVSQLCVDYNIPHLINNAYGFSLKRCINVIESACCRHKISRPRHDGDDLNTTKQAYGGVWAIVQSTDKNLLVPVGGAFVLSPHKNVIAQLSQLYAGRGSNAPTLDVFITLLSMGKNGYMKLMADREINFNTLEQSLMKCIDEINQKYCNEEWHRSKLLSLMKTKHNPISLAIDVTGLVDYLRIKMKLPNWSITELGSRLFYRSVSGARVIESAVRNTKIKFIEGYQFKGFGSSSDKSVRDYINVAAALGQKPEEIRRFISVFEEVIDEFINQSYEKYESVIISGDLPEI